VRSSPTEVVAGEAKVRTEADQDKADLAYLRVLDHHRQQAGITAAILRDGRAKGMLDGMKAILRWCDRGGEEPEGQCLHEIESICRKVLLGIEPFPQTEAAGYTKSWIWNWSKIESGKEYLVCQIAFTPKGVKKILHHAQILLGWEVTRLLEGSYLALPIPDEKPALKEMDEVLWRKKL
jgi:hypothetical protein